MVLSAGQDHAHLEDPDEFLNQPFLPALRASRPSYEYYSYTL